MPEGEKQILGCAKDDRKKSKMQVLRCAQDDKSLAQDDKSLDEKQIPCGNDGKKSTGKAKS